MSRFPVPLSTADLAGLAATSADQFRQQRLNATDAWAEHFQQARGKFEHLFRELNDLNPDAISDGKLADIYRLGLGEAIRYLAGPPISDDDLRVIADVDSLSPGALARDHQALRKVFGVIEKVMDPYRFPWVLSGKAPSPKQREAIEQRRSGQSAILDEALWHFPGGPSRCIGRRVQRAQSGASARPRPGLVLVSRSGSPRAVHSPHQCWATVEN